MKFIILFSIFLLSSFLSFSNSFSKEIDLLNSLSPALPYSNGTPSAAKGKTIVHYWATWCSSCIPEMRVLVDFLKNHSKEYDQFFLVSLDDNQQKYAFFWKELEKEKGLPHSKNIYTFLDPKRSLSKIGITMVPETHIFFNGKRIRNIIGNNDWMNKSFINFLQEVK